MTFKRENPNQIVAPQPKKRQCQRNVVSSKSPAVAGPGRQTSDASHNLIKTVEAPLNICDLDDDCLLQIFEHLIISELANMWSVNKRFRETTELTFHRRHIDDFVFDNIIGVSANYKRIFQSFGRSFKSLVMSRKSFDATIFDAEIVRWLANHCYGNLQSLELNGFSLVIPEGDNDLRLNMSRLVSSLTTLRLNGVEMLHCGTVFQSLSELIHLHLENVRMDFVTGNHLTRGYPHLQSAHLRDVFLSDCTFDHAHFTFHKFFGENSTIPSLNLNNFFISSSTPTYHVVDLITSHAPMLEDLTIQLTRDSEVTKLYRLDYLRKLKLELPNRSCAGFMLSLLSRKATLTHLDVMASDRNAEAFFHVIGTFNSLQSVVLRRASKVHAHWDFAYATRGLTNLVDFRTNCFEFSFTDTLIKFCERNPMLEVLWINEDDAVMFVDLEQYESFAAKRSPTAPKLVIFIMMSLSNCYRIRVIRDNLTVVYSGDWDHSDLGSNWDPLSGLYRDESVGQFFDYCRNCKDDEFGLTFNFALK